MWLLTEASLEQIWSWSNRERTSIGFAGGEDGRWERKVVADWLATFMDEMSDECKSRVLKQQCAEIEDMDLRLL